MAYSLSMPEFCEIARGVVKTLPEVLTPYFENLVIDVEEEPSEALLRSLGKSPHREVLLGLFVGIPVPHQDIFLRPPNRILIFKRPMEMCCHSHDELIEEIRKTILHELAHHFGWSEEDLADFENRRGTARDKRKKAGKSEFRPSREHGGWE